MENKQVFNPFMPLWEYVPDGEPHVFEGRLYLFGSHDVAGGDRYCAAGNYVGWSAPVEDLTDWRYEGVIYESKQDPRVNGEMSDLYAPDVVRGNDGRYYMYYGINGGVGSAGDDHNMPISVAVCDTPAGKYEYLGYVKNPDGTPYLKYLPGDPAVINDNGVIRLYHGWALSMVAADAHGGQEKGTQGEAGEAYGSEKYQQAGAAANQAAPNMDDLKKLPKEELRKFLLGAEQMLFHRTKEQLLADPEDVMGANHVVLSDDMLTVCGETSRIVPSQFMALGTEFEGHGFYEASSIRKIEDTYYFIYSDENSNMLSYATSKYPDRGFTYRGILQSNGDVGLNGRKGEDRVNMTANNHGSLENVNGQWYVFYHRQTHNSTYSRQACAEPVTINADGSISQAECTSCGLNGKPLRTEGTYPAGIACNLTNGCMPHATNRIVNADIPYITHLGEGQMITNIKEGTRIGYKYFAFEGIRELSICTRSCKDALAREAGYFTVFLDDAEVGKIIACAERGWNESERLAIIAEGRKALFLVYHGENCIELKDFTFRQNGMETV